MIYLLNNFIKIIDNMTLSDKISLSAALLSGLAVVISSISYYYTKRFNRSDKTISIWNAWISKDYRAYRVDANRAILGLRKNWKKDSSPPIRMLLRNREVEEAVGSIEHFVFEVSKLMERNLLDKRLFFALFDRSMNDWKNLLDGFNRGEGHDSFTDEELKVAFDFLIENPDSPGSNRFVWLRLLLGRPVTKSDL